MDALLIIMVWIVVAITAAIVAGNKGRSGIGWFLLCLVLTPLAILPLIALRPVARPPLNPCPPAAAPPPDP